jgi:predicted CXXCH cytochrome family protein
VTAVAGVESVTLSWDAVAGAASYRVYRALSPGVTPATAAAFDVAAPPWTDGALAAGQPCYYVVVSLDGSGAGGDPSAEASAVPAWPPRGSGPDTGQYFDRAIRPPDGQNYDDRSSHPLAGLTDNTLGTLLFGLTENCLRCHHGSGPERRSNECLKCHFEGGNAPTSNHRDGILQLARVVSDAVPPAEEFPVATLADYNAWCLQCHDGGSVSLGGITPSAARGTTVSAAAWVNGRHAKQPATRPVGCIYCHSPHGDANAQLVRRNPANRAGAGPVPARFGPFPSDNLDTVAPRYGKGGLQAYDYRARIDNASTPSLRAVFADASDEVRYCNRACHGIAKDREYSRDGTTGLYLLSPDDKRYLLIDGYLYTVDNVGNAYYPHVHVGQGIIPTDDMVRWWAGYTGQAGPALFHYPGLPGSDPSLPTPEWNRAAAVTGGLPFFPDFPDGSADYPDAYLSHGPIRYRMSCSTCHDTHGTLLGNSLRGDPAWPDLRMQARGGANPLCQECHN